MARRWCRNVLPGLVGGLSIAVLGALAAADNDAPILTAVLRHDATAVRQLLKSGQDVNGARGDGLTPLHAAAAEGDTAILAMLVSAGANVQAGTVLIGSTPLQLAAKNGQAAVVRMLLAHGADPDKCDRLGTSPLMLAAASGSAHTVAACSMPAPMRTPQNRAGERPR